MKVKIQKSTNPKKKYMAIFTDNGKKVKTTHFGSAGMSDFTINKDTESGDGRLPLQGPVPE